MEGTYIYIGDTFYSSYDEVIFTNGNEYAVTKVEEYSALFKYQTTNDRNEVHGVSNAFLKENFKKKG